MLAQQNPTVSVVITCYNYSAYIKDAIDSVLMQTYNNIELIVINDGSTDNSSDVIKAYKDKLRLIDRQNKGIVFTRNQAIVESGGSYLIQLDADDILPTTYVERMVIVALETNSDIVYADYAMFGEKTGKSNFPEFSLEELKNHNYINVSALVKKKAIGATRFDEALSGKTHEDWDFFLAMAVKGTRFAKCTTTYLKYRIHDNARNNAFGSLQDQRRYADVYAYVIDKHTRSNPRKFKYLVGRVFADWYAGIDNILTSEREKYNNEIRELARKNRVLERAADAIYKKTSLYRTVRYPRTTIYALLRTLRRNSPQKQLDTLAVWRAYRDVRREVAAVAKTSNLAVVIHLYYPELWPQMYTALARLNKIQNFDLFVSVPAAKLTNKIKEDITASFTSVCIVAVPNRGRDVLPFTQIMKSVSILGHDSVLKLHSKKSPHRGDGSEWFASLLETLVPEETTTLKTILYKLEQSTTGVIGPEKDYYSLLVNFPANKHHTIKIVRKNIASDTAGAVLYEDRDQHGFFGGTMFWARCEGLRGVINNSHISQFEIEAGQIDGTFAHSLERAFSLIPELQGKKMYGISREKVNEIENSSGIVPEWSTEHH